MTQIDGSIGIIGGSGMLGSAISEALLDHEVVPGPNFWISNRTGSAAGLERHAGIRITTDNQELVDACDVIILSVPPARASDIGIRAAGKLLVSVMAGVTVEEIKALTGASRVVRAMSSPAAALSLAYSPWFASPEVTEDDRRKVTAIFAACGLTDEIGEEGNIDHFTAMTGPVPGFVAYFAKCMADYAVGKGIGRDVADRAIRQLFLSAGTMMSTGEATPADHVREMIDYAGTTAAGLLAMENSPLSRAIHDGLDAAVEKSRNMRR